MKNLIIHTKQKKIYLERCIQVYGYWHKYLSRQMYAHRLLVDASNFIGVDMFTLLHDNEYSFGFKNVDEMENHIKSGLKKLEFNFSLKSGTSEIMEIPKVRRMTKSLQLLLDSELSLKQELDQSEESRMNAEIVFGGSLENDAKVFDMPINDELYKSKYKKFIVDNKEQYPEREYLFSFFRYYTISDAERKELWRTRIGNSLGITQELYDALCIRLEIEGIDKKYRKLIHDDLFRTLPNYGSTKVGETMYNRLLHILSLFQMYRPDVGYVQGMSFLIVMLYYYFDEFDTFVVFTNLIFTRPLVWICYDFNMPDVNVYSL